ncbi:MAG: NAD(P)/FAD-dependent oxidoreductase [Treponema sp.]
MAQTNVIIIGAGIAGLATGTYLQSSGFKVTILEQHTIPGGLSTSWRRKGYLFEGGMHWLTGSSPKFPLNRIWHEVGALKDNNPVFNKDPFYTLLDGDKTLNLYRDVDKLEKYFINFAPEDEAAIKHMCHDIRRFLSVHTVVTDIWGLKTKQHMHPSLIELCAMIPAVFRMSPLLKQSYPDYVSQFKNNEIRHLLLSVVGMRYNAAAFVYTMASFASGDCGYPEGGSLRMAQNMADTFTALGGTIQFSTKVTGIVTKNGVTTGVNTEDTFIPADKIVITQDTRQAVDSLFNPPLNEKWAQKMRKTVITEQNMFLCLGIKADLSKYPLSFIIPLDVPFEAAGLSFEEVCLHNYSTYKGYAPEGCTPLTCLLLGPSYNWWKAKKADGTYKQEKEALIQRFIIEVKKHVPEIADNVEVTDVATPCTYERYTGSFEGSWMSVWESGGASFTLPAKSQTIKGIYFAGERSMMPGGLPITVLAGRRAAQTLCKDTNTEFVAPRY